MVADYGHVLVPELSKVKHCYGENVLLVSDPLIATMLARLSNRMTRQPQINSLVRKLYEYLAHAVISNTFPRKAVSVITRMADSVGTDLAELKVMGLSPHTKVVCVDIARAGMIPSQICFDMLCDLFDPDAIRQDHMVMQRTTDEEGRVTGADISGSKIGGPIEGCFVLFPDPMGATGTSLCDAITHFKEADLGEPEAWITLNLIITPEFIRRVQETHPEVVIYALRLDRGMSPRDVITDSLPGTYWDQETGLNEVQYIVPGAGGMGEIINNAFV